MLYSLLNTYLIVNYGTIGKSIDYFYKNNAYIGFQIANQCYQFRWNVIANTKCKNMNMIILNTYESIVLNQCNQSIWIVKPMISLRI